MRIVFEQQGTFAAMYAAEEWCRSNGISVGCGEKGKPRGLLLGDFAISKWRNMNASEIAALDGRMTGDMRDGPVIIEMKKEILMENIKITMTPCTNSSQVVAHGYDAATSILAVQYKNGGMYHYKDVPAKLYEELLAAESAGKFIHAEVKSVYEFVKVAEVTA